MKILQKKVCMIGDFGVGKTSLVARFVKSEFSDKYLTTVGVKMDTKLVEINSELKVKLVLWDIAGDNNLNSKTVSYLRGTSGFVFVADGTRNTSLESVFTLKTQAEQLLGETPFVILLNKYDLVQRWDISKQVMQEMQQKDWLVFYTSAKTGENVEQAFLSLSQKMTT